MCLIVYNETGRPYDMGKLRAAYENNQHGFGCMWVERYRIYSIRDLLDFDDIRTIVNELRGYPHALHFRFRTRGKLNKDQCHPFEACTKNGRVLMMHNGTFHHIQPSPTRSDSDIFAEHLRNYTSVHGSNCLFDNTYLQQIERRVTRSNKLLFLRNDGKVAIVNPSEWTIIDGVWYSNTYSLVSKYRDKKLAEDRRALSGEFNRLYNERIMSMHRHVHNTETKTAPKNIVINTPKPIATTRKKSVNPFRGSVVKRHRDGTLTRVL